jgi:hypothetical protein
VEYISSKPEFIKEYSSKELIISKELFNFESTTIFWKFALIAVFNGTQTQTLSTSSSVTIFINKLPSGGSCSITPLSGILSVTDFTVTCLNWFDSDGYIKHYEFSGIFSQSYERLNSRFIKYFELSEICE